MHFNFCSRFMVATLVATAFLCTINPAVAQEVTNKQKNEVKQITKSLDRAGRLYKSKKYESCAEEIIRVQARLENLSSNPGKELIELVRPEYARLVQAHKLLTEAKLELPELKPLPEPIDPDAAAMVSFKTAVAPILIEKCGRCHVNNRRGQFSAANYTSLMQSTHVAVGAANDSRIIEVIVDGDMPPNGNVEKEKLDILKLWIQQGAKFDGDDANQNLNQLTGAPPANTPRRNVQVSKPTGKETVSFGLDVAPILIENCSTCHMTMQNARGNLNMSTFRQLLTGGDAGPAIEPGRSGDSLLVKRLEAGEMPPSGKLDAKLIRTIATWIDEGAKFDPAEARLPVTQVAAKAKADSQSHEELLADRLRLAQKNWKLVMTDIEPVAVRSDNFILIGSMDEDTLDKLSKTAESISEKVKAALKADRKRPLVKGNSAVYVFDRRYDFSEFGRMLESRALPKDISSYWGYTTVDAYSAVLLSDDQSPDDIQVSLARQITAVYAASLAPDMPRWFADGLGYWTAEKIFPRDDEVATWESQASAVARKMARPDDFMAGRLPDHDAALVSYLFVKQLRSDSSRFNRLLGFLRSGQTFEFAFEQSYGKKPTEIYGGR